jgi:superoxide dismutase, Fe-Mn family
MYELMEFDSIGKELDGISKQTMESHYKLYEGYVKKANEITEKLESVDRDPAKANQIFSELRELKVELSFAIGGIKNHVNYFSILGGQGGKPTGSLLEQIEKDFGSFDEWAADLKATGIAARGWVWLAYDWDTKKLFNYLGDAQNTFPIWNTTMILALDTYEHAYWLDYQQNRGAYIDAFMKNLNWQPVEQVWDIVNGMKS